MNRNSKKLSASQNRSCVSGARVFKALGDENRLRIAAMLATGETNACDLMDELNISQPTLSHHLKILTDEGVTRCEKDGKWRIYSLTDLGKAAVEFLFNMT